MKTLLSRALTSSLVFFLAACGGSGDNNDGDPTAKVDREQAIDRLEQIIEQADTVLASRTVGSYTLREGSFTVSGTEEILLTCSGRECRDDSDFVISVSEVLEGDEEQDLELISPTIASRGGFHTGKIETSLDDLLNDFLEDPVLTEAPSLELFAAWGEHGAATLLLMTGDIRGEFEGMPFSGNFQFATHMVIGDATGTNPTGLGSATWRGVAEAVSTSTFARHTGTADITIRDLSDPLVSASIALDGQEIGAWPSMPLHQGRYESGQPGSENHLVGSFHGPNHEETYGVFDTGSHLGSYGAMKN